MDISISPETIVRRGPEPVAGGCRPKQQQVQLIKAVPPGLTTTVYYTGTHTYTAMHTRTDTGIQNQTDRITQTKTNTHEDRRIYRQILSDPWMSLNSSDTI